METNFKLKKNSLLIKVSIIIVLILVMLIPINMIQSLIEERENNQENVKTEISQKWGGPQYIMGPILALPYVLQTDSAKKQIIRYAYFLPDDFQVDGNINAEERSRTLYQTLVYQSDMHISGKFSMPDYSALDLKAEQIKWEDAHIIIGISDIQGVKNKIVFNINNKPQAIQPGMSDNSLANNGLTIKTPIDPASNTQTFDFSFDLLLNGSDCLSFIPVGKENKIHLKSPWKTVSFVGNMLPTERNITDQGFDAQWNILDYSRVYPQMWLGENELLRQSTLGVELRYPIDQYQMTMRSAKYAIMFIGLTFVVFFLIELISRKRIHPAQYLLVSCALVLFYSLLLALSEHIGFGVSYLISALATTMLITTYSTTIFKSKKLSILMGLFLSILYIYLYVILQMENMALLFGSIGLFISLAIVMYVSRKINWYKNDDYESDNSTSTKPVTPPPFGGGR